jgi:hypothetical protein
MEVFLIIKIIYIRILCIIIFKNKILVCSITDFDVTLADVLNQLGARGGTVVETLRYKPEGRGIDSRWSHWNFSLT